MHQARSWPAAAGTRLLLLLTVLLAALAIAPASASAHAMLLETVPANEQTVDNAPEEVTLRFDENVTVAFGGTRVFGPDGERIDAGAARVDGGSTVRIPVRAGDSGTHAVSWRVISADGHPVRGAFVFHVGERSGTAASEQALAATQTNRTHQTAYGVARGFSLLGMLLAVGAIGFLVIVDRSWNPRVLVPALAAFVAASAAAFVLDAALAGGFSIAETLDPSVLREQATTVYGRAAAARTVLAAVALVIVAARPGAALLAGVPLAGAVIAQSASGHAMGGDPAWLRVAADAVHTLAAGLWIGGLVQLYPYAKARPDAIRQVNRYSSTALVSVALIVATGLYAAFYTVGLSSEALLETSYGRLLLGKSLLFVCLMGFGAANKQWHVPALSSDDGERVVWGRRRLRRFVAGEVMILVLVVSLTAWLIASMPARDEVAPQMVQETLELRGGRSVQLVVDPAAAGPNELHLYVLDEQLQPDGAVTELRVEGSNEQYDIENLAIDVTAAGPGHYTAPAATIPYSGTWRFTVHIARGEFSEERASFDAEIAPAGQRATPTQETGDAS